MTDNQIDLSLLHRHPRLDNLLLCWMSSGSDRLPPRTADEDEFLLLSFDRRQGKETKLLTLAFRMKPTLNKTGTSQVGAISQAQIKSKEGPFRDKENFREKVAQCRKKNRKRDPLVPSGFVGYV